MTLDTKQTIYLGLDACSGVAASVKFSIDTKQTIYLGLDAVNAEVTILVPRGFPYEIVELNLADRDPDNTDSAQFTLLEEVMESTTYEI